MTYDGLASRTWRVDHDNYTPSRFMLQKLGISSSSYQPVGFKLHFFSKVYPPVLFHGTHIFANWIEFVSASSAFH